MQRHTRGLNVLFAFSCGVALGSKEVLSLNKSTMFADIGKGPSFDEMVIIVLEELWAYCYKHII